MNQFPAKSSLLLGLLLIGFVCAAHAEKSDHDKPIQIVSDRMNVDDANHVSTFEGKVDLVQGTLHLMAEKIVVTEDAAGNKHCVATGRPASFRQRREETNEQVEGYGERIEYDSSLETVDLYVQARVKRDQDDVRGDHITYSTQTEVFHVSGRQDSGRVRATIQPKNKDAPPAPKSGAPKTLGAAPQPEKLPGN